MTTSSLGARTIMLVRREWYIILVACVVVFSVVGTNIALRLRAAGDFEILQYEPRTLPTLSVIQHMRTVGWNIQSLIPIDALVAIPEQLQASYGPLLFTWLVSRFISSVFAIIVANQLASAVVCTICAYGAFRIGRCEPYWAMLGSIAYGIIPARFYWSDVFEQWFVAVPIATCVVLAVWHRPHVLAWRQWDWSDWGIFAGAILLCGMFGKAAAFVVVLVLVLVAISVYMTTRTKDIMYLCVGSAGGLWLFVQIQVWMLINPQIARSLEYSGLSLAPMVLPHANHLITPLAVIGQQYASLVIEHTNTYYLGALAVLGFGLLCWRAIGVFFTPNQHIPHYEVVGVFVLLLIANQHSIGAILVWLRIFPFTQWNHVSIWIMIMSLYTALYTLQSLTVQRHLPQAIIVVLCTVVVVIDQTPSTMLLPNLKKSVVEATPHTWPEGLLLSQSALPSDVTAVRGLMDVIPGYGRWATSNANQVVIEFAKPVPPQLTLHIRVKSASDHSNFVLPIRLGNTTQRITLSDTIQEFIIPFHTDGTATQLVLDVGTSNSNDRGEVFVQSLWADVP